MLLECANILIFKVKLKKLFLSLVAQLSGTCQDNSGNFIVLVYQFVTQLLGYSVNVVYV